MLATKAVVSSVGILFLFAAAITVFNTVSEPTYSNVLSYQLPSPSPATSLHDINVRYTHDSVGSSHANGNGQCSAGMNTKIQDALAAVAPAVKKGVQMNKPLFDKWFGKATSDETDANVMKKLNDAAERLPKFNKDDGWVAECCPYPGDDIAGDSNDRGCADNCIGNVLAFVYGSTWGDSKKSYTRVRLCSTMWDQSDATFGLTLFHELSHMTSESKDGTGDYSKTALITNAKNNPNLARTTANNFMMYMAQNGMSHTDYEAASSPWGGPVDSLSCSDKWTSCHMLASNAVACSKGNMMSDCCHSCNSDYKSDAPCVDKNKASCDGWAAPDGAGNSQCTINPGYMIPNCAKACGFCSSGGSDATGGGSGTEAPTGAAKTGTACLQSRQDWRSSETCENSLQFCTNVKYSKDLRECCGACGAATEPTAPPTPPPALQGTACLQARQDWRSSETCENSVAYCTHATYGKDLQECCPGACGTAASPTSPPTAPATLTGTACLLARPGWTPSETCENALAYCTMPQYAKDLKECCGACN